MPPGFSMGASLNKPKLLCELGAWEKPRPREKQTSPAPGLRINTGSIISNRSGAESEPLIYALISFQECYATESSLGFSYPWEKSERLGREGMQPRT